MVCTARLKEISLAVQTGVYHVPRLKLLNLNECVLKVLRLATTYFKIFEAEQAALTALR